MRGGNFQIRKELQMKRNQDSTEAEIKKYVALLNSIKLEIHKKQPMTALELKRHLVVKLLCSTDLTEIAILRRMSATHDSRHFPEDNYDYESVKHSELADILIEMDGPDFKEGVQHEGD